MNKLNLLFSSLLLRTKNLYGNCIINTIDFCQIWPKSIAFCLEMIIPPHLARFCSWWIRNICSEAIQIAESNWSPLPTWVLYQYMIFLSDSHLWTCITFTLSSRWPCCYCFFLYVVSRWIQRRTIFHSNFFTKYYSPFSQSIDHESLNSHQ